MPVHFFSGVFLAQVCHCRFLRRFGTQVFSHRHLVCTCEFCWVTTKHSPHLQYELWSSCGWLRILQQTVLGNGCRNDDPISFHGISLDSTELHQILARSQLWHRQKIHKPESFCNSLVEAYRSFCYLLPQTGKDSEHVGPFAMPQNIEGTARLWSWEL